MTAPQSLRTPRRWLQAAGTLPAIALGASARLRERSLPGLQERRGWLALRPALAQRPGRSVASRGRRGAGTVGAAVGCGGRSDRARRAALAVSLLAWVLSIAPADAAGALAGRRVAGAESSSVPAPAGGRALLDVDAVVGFSDTFRPGHWTPISVTVDNRGRAIEGHLELEVSEGDDLTGRRLVTTHRRPLALARDSRKRLAFTVFLAGLSHPLIIRVVAGGRELVSKALDLRPRFTASRLVLVVSRDADLDYLNDSGDDGLRILYPHPQLLPERWQGYDSVAALVLHGISLEPLSARQFEALSRWIAGGGTLFVSGGPDYGLLRTPRLSGLLPARPVATVRLSEPAQVRDAFGTPLEVTSAFHINRVADVRGRVLHRAGAHPLVVERSLGEGRVVYLTFDLARAPFDRWEGMTALWLSDLRIVPERPPRPAAREPIQLNPVMALIGSQDSGFPEHITVFLFLALYLGVLLVGYRLRASGAISARLAAPATWAAPVAFAPIAWLVFNVALFERGATAAVVALIEPIAGSPYARLGLDLGMHSNRSGTLQLELAGAEPVLRPRLRAAERGAPVRWVILEGRSGALQAADRRRYVLHLLEGRDIVPYRLEASVVERQLGPALEVVNDTGWPLHDLWLVIGASAYPVGSVAPGARSLQDFDRSAEAVSVEGDGWRRLLRAPGGSPPRSLSAVQALLERRLAGPRPQPLPAPGRALLVGRAPSPLRASGASAAWRYAHSTLVLFEFPIDGSDEPTQPDRDPHHRETSGGDAD